MNSCAKNEAGTRLTEGPIVKKMLLFALPIFLGNVFQQMYNTADSLIVGRFLDETALAAVASSGSLVFMMIGFFQGVAMGGGVVISRYYGANDQEKLTRAIHTTVAFGIAASITLTILGVAFTPTILRWMGTPENVLPHSIAYFRVYSCGTSFVIMYNIFVGILQAVGDSKHPLYYLIVSSLINIALDLLFVGVFRWGVWAAALATIISQAISVLLALRRLSHPELCCHVELRLIGFDMPSLREIIGQGLPSGFQNSIIAIANLVVQSNINQFGDIAMAGCGAYFKLEGFVFLPISCFSMALATFVSQNIGAKQYQRVKTGAVFATVCAMLLAEVVGFLMYHFSPPLIALFNSSPEVIDFGVRQAHLESMFYWLLAFSHCAAGMLRGAGRPKVPMFTMLAVWCVLRISYITVMVRIIPQIETVFSAYPLTWTVSSVIFAIYLFRSGWTKAPQEQLLSHC